MDHCDVCKRPIAQGDMCEKCEKRAEVLKYHFRIRHDAHQARVDAIHHRYEVPEFTSAHSTIGPKWRLSG
jgi:hypothetical protein